MRTTRFFIFLSLLALTIAAWTGVLLRFGLVDGLPVWAQNISAVRHAHSHLMYFGWVTLGLMTLIWHYLPHFTGQPNPRGVHWQLAASAVAALLSFPAFWSNGYGLTQIGDADLPLGSMSAGLNALTWILFAVLYVRATRGLADRPLPIRLWDWSVSLMALSFLGIFGLVGVVFSDQSNPIFYQFFLHLFLDLFAMGWFGLAVLGVIWAQLGKRGLSAPALPAGSLGLALIPTFFLGMSPIVVSPAMFWVGVLANAVAGLLLARHLLALGQVRADLASLSRFALPFLAIHIGVALLLLVPGIWRWTSGTQLRIFFLHNFLLGWISSMILGECQMAGMLSSRSNWMFAGSWFWKAGVVFMLGTLLALGFAQGLPVPPYIWLHLAAWSSVLVALSVTLFLGAAWTAVER